MDKRSYQVSESHLNLGGPLRREARRLNPKRESPEVVSDYMLRCVLSNLTRQCWGLGIPSAGSLLFQRNRASGALQDS